MRCKKDTIGWPLDASGGLPHKWPMIQIGRYTRKLGASIERLFENALDWEHLPHLHGGSFAGIALIESDATGWCAVAQLPAGQTIELELRLDRTAGRWVTDSRAGGQTLSRIITDARATGPESCAVDVTFVAPDGADRAASGRYFESLYARLYDEDEAMMVARAAALRAGPIAHRQRREVVLADGSTHSIPLVCPHQGLPLDADPDADGIIACPWHGYRFDAASGRCVSGQIAGWGDPTR